MNVLLLMVPMAVFLGMVFLAFFILAVMKGQYDDLDTPAHRMLIEEETTDSIKEGKNE